MRQNENEIRIKDFLGFLEDIINTLRESVLVLDGELRVLRANDSFYKNFYTTKKLVEGRFFYKLARGEWDIPKLRKLLKSVLPQKRIFEDFEVERVFEGIGRRTMLLNARQLKIRVGREPLILLAIEDVTEKKKVLASLLQTGKLAAIGQLSAGIVHGLSSPLTGVANFVDVYLHQEKPGSLRYKELKIMHEGCRYMIDIIKNLTDFAANKGGSFKPVNLAEVVKSVLLFTERQFAIRNICIIQSFPNNLNIINGDRNQLQHAILNIMINSLESMNKGGKLTFRARNIAASKRVVLEIEDTGKGIKREYLPRLFEPFFTTKKIKSGAGLGLAVVYGIVQHHNGKISVESVEKKRH